MARTSPPPFTKRRRPEPEAAPAKIADKRAPAEDVRTDAEVWEPITGDEMSDTLQGVFDGLTEGFGPEWTLEESRARKMGERWARIVNRFAKRARSLFVLRLLVYFTLGFACVELGAIVIGRTLKTIRRRREEAAEELKRRKAAGREQPSNVVQIGPQASADGGGG
jgi:hypothetical protein